MSIFIALLAAIGVGTIISALVGHSTAISNLRQAWINALRDDLAEYIRQLEKMNDAMADFLRDSEQFEGQKREARTAVLFIYERIRLRLNKNEDSHQRLEQKLGEFINRPLGEAMSGRAKINETIDLARDVLKCEWETTKYPWKPFWRKLRKRLSRQGGPRSP